MIDCSDRIQKAPQLFFLILNQFRASFIQMKLSVMYF